MRNATQPSNVRCVPLTSDLGIVLFAVLFVPSLAASAEKFLQIEGVQGESTDPTHVGWSEVAQYRLILKDPNTGKVQCKAIITKMIDAASPFIWTMTANGVVTPKAILEVTNRPAQDPDDDQNVFFRLTMDGVRSQRVVNEEGVESTLTSSMETMTFLPQSMTLEYFRRSPETGGSSGVIGSTVDCS